MHSNMNADEIVKALSDDSFCEDCRHYGEPNGCNRDSVCEMYNTAQDAADLIESPQAENARLRAERDAAGMIESLQTQLAEAQRRADAAIKDMECYIGRVFSPNHGNYACCICKHADNDCGMLGGCNGLSHWEWRGPQE